ncbi:cache and HAMP domain-containing protein [bacterium]|nr:cache and HAMP domain-containing protein [candidate division CSSED10-310 bacterium]
MAQALKRNKKMVVRLTLLVTFMSGIPVAFYFMALYQVTIPALREHRDHITRELEIRTRELHYTAAREVKERVEDLMERAERKLTAVTEGSVFADLSSARQKDVITTLFNDSDEFSRIILFDSVAHYIFSAYSVTDGPDADLSSAVMQLNLSIAIPDQRFYSAVYTDSARQHLLVGIGAPFFHEEGDIGGFLWGEVDLTYLAERLASHRLGAMGEVSMVDREGRLIFANDLQAALDRTDVSSDPLTVEFIRNVSGGLLQYNAGDIPMVGTYLPLPDYGWGVLTKEPWEAAFLGTVKLEEKIDNLVLRLRLLGMIIASFAFFSVMFASYHFRTAIRDPLKRLESALIDLAEGDMTGYVSSGRLDEVGRLLDVYNRVVKRIRDTWGAHVDPDRH